MTSADDQRLTRIEGMLTMLLRRAELEDDTFTLILNVSEVVESHLKAIMVRERIHDDIRDANANVRAVYRRGYFAGRSARQRDGKVRASKATADLAFERGLVKMARRAA